MKSGMDRSEYFKKLYFKQWVIGLSQGNIGDIIRTKTFKQDIKWLPLDVKTRFYADPFPLSTANGELSIIFEDFSINENYGNISVMTLDKNLDPTKQKVLIDTKIHMSFPFIFREDNRIFVFPESARKGNVSCYEYDSQRLELSFVTEILRMPLYDPAILKWDGKYWLFGSIFEKRSDYKLHVFHSEKLHGPYMPLPGNPVRSGIDAVRAAGNFIVVDGNIYRPTQNCGKEYGESITINRITNLDENNFTEAPYMEIKIDKKNLHQNNIHTIHTLNVADDLIVVDGQKWTFSLSEQWKNFRRNRRLLKESSTIAH
jgi:hypothetical protein